MCKDEILDRVLGTIKGLGLPIDRVDRNTMLVTMGLDSLDRVEMVMQLEEEFDCDIEFQEEDKWQTIGDVCKAMEED